jgi:hypothetical protein
VDVERIDVSTYGGITRLRETIGQIEERGIPFAPHMFPHTHSQVFSALGYDVPIEWGVPGTGVDQFSDALQQPVVRDGLMDPLPEEPGVGTLHNATWMAEQIVGGRRRPTAEPLARDMRPEHEHDSHHPLASDRYRRMVEIRLFEGIARSLGYAGGRDRSADFPADAGRRDRRGTGGVLLHDGGQCTLPVTRRRIGGAGGRFGTQHRRRPASLGSTPSRPGYRDGGHGRGGVPAPARRSATPTPCLLRAQGPTRRKGLVERERGAIAKIGQAAMFVRDAIWRSSPMLLMLDPPLEAAESPLPRTASRRRSICALPAARPPGPCG